jgi:hypothetical protein
MVFNFTFEGNEKAAEQFLAEYAVGTGLSLNGEKGKWDLAQGLKRDGAYPADVWSKLRLIGEASWEEPDQLFTALQKQGVNGQHIFQWLGFDFLANIPGYDVDDFFAHPPVSVSLAVREGLQQKITPFQLQQVWTAHPLFSKTKGWMQMRPWGRDSGLIIEANPFAPEADKEVFLIMIRDAARRLPLAADIWGFRLVRCWVSLSACRALLRQVNVLT